MSADLTAPLSASVALARHDPEAMRELSEKAGRLACLMGPLITLAISHGTSRDTADASEAWGLALEVRQAVALLAAKAGQR